MEVGFRLQVTFGSGVAQERATVALKLFVEVTVTVDWVPPPGITDAEAGAAES